VPGVGAGHDGSMTGAELLTEAVAELYASDLDAFIERRRVLAAQARSAGEASAAKRIAGLRKPTRSAWVINQLVRADPSVTPGLDALGDQLRAAEAALDGAKIRELSRARRQLIDTLVRRALALSGQPSPPAALREEVTATFSAALADPQVAAELAAGTLLRPAHRAGFGSGTGPPQSGTEPSRAGTEPPLALVPSPGNRRPGPAATRPATPARPATQTAAAQTAAAQAAAEAAEAQAAAEARAAAEAQAKADREHRQAIAEAEQAVADADVAADAAVQAEQEQERAIQIMEEQLADTRQRLVGARQGLAEARLQARLAKSAQQKARQALGRLGRFPSAR
jgi:hypothetical protein